MTTTMTTTMTMMISAGCPASVAVEAERAGPHLRPSRLRMLAQQPRGILSPPLVAGATGC
jgi:hypothetical protein